MSAKQTPKSKKDYYTILGTYHELINAVKNRTHGETKHETALRYIREAEAPTPAPRDME